MKSIASNTYRATSWWLLAPVLALTGLAAAPAAGQTGARGVIEEIVVTARKREEALQSVPLAVSAFSANDIVDRQIRAVEDIARFTPGLSFAKAFGRSTDRPVIRGQGNVLAGVQFGVESGAAYFIDGVYYPGDLSSLDMNNVERIEVIRGPQSALYGRNTYAGAINFITKSPGDELTGDVRVRWGQDEDIEFNAVARGALIPGLLAGSIAARYQSFDGEYRNTVTGKIGGDEETRAISGTLEFAPLADLLIRTRLAYQEDRDGTRPFFLQPSESNNCFPGTRSNASWNFITGSSNNNQYFCGKINRPGNTYALNDGPPLTNWLSDPRNIVPGIPNAVIPPGFFTASSGAVVPAAGGNPYNDALGLPFSGVHRDLFHFSTLAEWDIAASGWTLVGAVTYRDEDRKTGSDSDHSPINFLSGGRCTFCASDFDKYEDYSFELRLESPADRRLRWMIGGFYFDQDQERTRITFAQPSGGAPIDISTVRNWAGFGMVEFDFTDRISATAELRYFDEKKTLKEFKYGPAFLPGRGSDAVYDAVNNQTVIFNDSASFDEFAPRITLNWQFLDDALLYATWAQGYKPGGLNGSAGLTVTPDPLPTYAQESADSYEIGLKSAWLDNRLIANLSLFYLDTSKIQLTTALSTGTGTLTSIVTNQGSGKTKGAELEIQLAATDELTLGVNYALADTEFRRGCDPDEWILRSGGGQLTDAVNCTGVDLNGQGSGSIKGRQFPLSSKHQVGVFGDYRRMILARTEFFTNISLNWEDKKPVQVHNQAWVPSATLLDAKIGLETERLTFALYGRNLTDEDAPNMVTRWLQDPLLNALVGDPDFVAGGGPAAAACTFTLVNPCSVNYPRAFFGDYRRGRNIGLEFAWRFGL